MDKKDLEHLGHLESFQRFVAGVYYMREQAIGDLSRSADPHAVMQMSGKIAALDDILQAASWETLRDRMQRP